MTYFTLNTWLFLSRQTLILTAILSNLLDSFVHISVMYVFLSFHSLKKFFTMSKPNSEVIPFLSFVKQKKNSIYMLSIAILNLPIYSTTSSLIKYTYFISKVKYIFHVWLAFFPVFLAFHILSNLEAASIVLSDLPLLKFNFFTSTLLFF